VWEWNARTGELDWDDGMLELFEAKERPREALASVWRERVHPDDQARVAAEMRRALNGDGDFDTRYRVAQREGGVLWLAAHGVVVRDPNGDAARLVGLSIDITREVNDHEALARARDQAEAANRAKSQFLANMSHEIRTPLTAILGYADLLRDDGDATKAPPHRIELIETIRSAGSHLLEIINDILDLSKIEAGRMTVERVEFSLPEIVAGVETLLRSKADAKGIALHVSLDSAIPDRIVGDPTRVRQVLVNLAGNAVKFTERGSVAIRISAGERLRFDVEDSGVGMTAEQSRRLFEAFTQADATVTRRHGGTGLGLVICRRLARLMGGEITLVRTEPDRGSVFRFDLPLERAPGSTELRTLDAARATGRPLTDAGVTLRARVLLAEDGPDNQRLITFYLKRAGAEVEVAENGRLALDAFDRAKASGKPFDLVITDVQMPVMDGYTFARALRDAGSAVPIVALTAHAMAEDRERSMLCGCNGYATKPIDAGALLRICAGLVGAAAPAG
jgi:signal transduction histidine kinase/ActR/RegA family two-component response regulator